MAGLSADWVGVLGWGLAGCGVGWGGRGWVLGGGLVGWVWLGFGSSVRFGLVGRGGGPLIGGGWAFLVCVRAFSEVFTFDLGP